MANPHPNMSGLRPFNTMDPDEAKRIRRLGGIAHAKQYFMAKDINEMIRHAKAQTKKDYQNIEYSLIKHAIDIVCNSHEDFDKRLRMMNFINKLQKNANSEIDKMNAVAYKTSPRDVQLSDDYDTMFLSNDDDDVQFIDEEFDIRPGPITIGGDCSDTCSETQQ